MFSRLAQRKSQTAATQTTMEMDLMGHMVQSFLDVSYKCVNAHTEMSVEECTGETKRGVPFQEVVSLCTHT